MRAIIVALAATALFAAAGRAGDEAQKSSPKKTRTTTMYNPKDLTVDRKVDWTRKTSKSNGKTTPRELGDKGTVNGTIIGLDEKSRSFDVQTTKEIVRIRVKGAVVYHGPRAPHEVDEIKFSFEKIATLKGDRVLVIKEADKTTIFGGVD